MSDNNSVAQTAQKIIKCFQKGNKLLICGNGGSATMSSHMAAEFINKLEYDREPLPAIALTTDVANLTSIANDSDYKWVFSRQIHAIGKTGDILIIFTTTPELQLHTEGHSANIFHAATQARLQLIDVIFAPIPSKYTTDSQEAQLKWMHSVCREVEKAFV